MEAGVILANQRARSGPTANRNYVLGGISGVLLLNVLCIFERITV